MKKYRLYFGRTHYGLCPQCNKWTFVFYVDQTNQPLYPLVGRCNRSTYCRYHYKPSDYFADMENKAHANRIQTEEISSDDQPF